MNEARSQSALDWLADQYLLGELSDHEARAFEDRLAVDQNSREALAGAVELYQAIKIASESRESQAHPGFNRSTPLPPSSNWFKSASSLAVSAAAVLVMVGVLNLLWSPDSDSESNRATSLLASEWTEFRDLTEDAFGDSVSRNDLTDNSWDGLSTMTAPEDIGESSWLLTALAPQVELPGENQVHQQ